MIDTSALVAALVGDHEFHSLARPHLNVDSVIPAIVLAETYAQLRRTFGQSAGSASALLRPWTSDSKRIAATTSEVVSTVFGRAAELNLGGSIHDALICATCAAHALPLTTLDRRQHALGLALGVSSTLLLTAE